MWEVLPQKLVTPKKWFKKMVTPKKNVTQKNWSKRKWLPPKKCYPKKKLKKWLPQKCWRTLLRGGLLLHFGKMAYFIAYGFINAIQTLFCRSSWTLLGRRTEAVEFPEGPKSRVNPCESNLFFQGELSKSKLELCENMFLGLFVCSSCGSRLCLSFFC